MPDDPPRRTPPRSGEWVPRPSKPELFSLFEQFLEQYGAEQAQGISNYALMEQLTSLRGELRAAETGRINFELAINKRVAVLEGATEERRAFQGHSTGRFDVLPLPFPPAVPPAPKSTPPKAGFFERAVSGFFDQLTKNAVPLLIGALAAWLGARGCLPLH